MKLNKRRIGGFSLIEVTAVTVVIGILVGGVFLMIGSARDRTLSSRVSTDLETLNAAKRCWQLDHEVGGGGFPGDEAGRFAALQPYLQSQRSLANIAAMQPSGYTYSINDLGVPASSTP